MFKWPKPPDWMTAEEKAEEEFEIRVDVALMYSSSLPVPSAEWRALSIGGSADDVRLAKRVLSEMRRMKYERYEPPLSRERWMAIEKADREWVPKT